MSKFNNAVIAIFQDRRIGSVTNILTNEVAKLLHREKIKAKTFTYMPKIYFRPKGDKAEILVGMEITLND